MTQDIDINQRFHAWVYEKFVTITPSGAKVCKCGIEVNSKALYEKDKRASQLVDHILGKNHVKASMKLLEEAIQVQATGRLVFHTI